MFGRNVNLGYIFENKTQKQKRQMVSDKQKASFRVMSKR